MTHYVLACFDLFAAENKLLVRKGRKRGERGFRTVFSPGA